MPDSFKPDNPRRILGAVRNDFLGVFDVPPLDSLGADVMDSISESDALTKVPARRLTELARTPLDKLGEIFHNVRLSRNLISIFPPTAQFRPTGWERFKSESVGIVGLLSDLLGVKPLDFRL